jgi:ribonuclease P protein component
MEEKFSHAEGPEAARNLAFLTKEDLSSPAKKFAAFELSRLQGKNTFGKDEKLKSDKLIEQLFKEGKSVSKDGFTLVYLIQDIQSMYPARAGFSVPKRNFKHAVDRNRAKRLMREVYRTRKIMLYEKLVAAQKQLAIMWVYKGKELPTYAQTEKVMLECMEKVMGKL